MAEEGATADLLELARQASEAGMRGDFDAMMRFFAADAVWDAPAGSAGSRAPERSAVSTKTG